MTVHAQTMNEVDEKVKEIIEQSDELLIIRIVKNGESNLAVHCKFDKTSSVLQKYLAMLLADIMSRSNAKAADQADS